MSDLIRTLARQLAEQSEAARNSSSVLRAVDAVEYKPQEHWVRQDPEDYEDPGYFSMRRAGLPAGALYHVGPLDAIKRIAADGAIKPAAAVGKTPNFASENPGLHDYGKHSANRSFLTDAGGLDFWLPKIHGRVRHQASDPNARVGILAFEDPRAVPARRYSTHDQDLHMYGSPFPVIKEPDDELGHIARTDWRSLEQYDALRERGMRANLAESEHAERLHDMGIHYPGPFEGFSMPPAILQPPVKPGAPVLHYDNLGTPHAESYAFFINGPAGTRVEVPPELARKIAAMSLMGPLMAPATSPADTDRR